MTNSSSNIEKKQRVGRVIRLEGSDKIAEVFTFVIKGTMEESWFSKSTGNDAHITIDEENLLRLLIENQSVPKTHFPENIFWANMRVLHSRQLW